MQLQTILRVARPTNDLEAVIRFYRDGLGLAELYRFEDHDGFDGVMLGQAGAPYHFEFTRARGHDAGRAPTQDNLIVFYLPHRAEWEDAISRMKSSGFPPVPSFNPFWDKQGMTFEDCDGYRVVLHHSDWRASEQSSVTPVA
jgi:catechol 2,3-dioxygenase-like lactoylglutathione lyase family enzyme